MRLRLRLSLKPLQSDGRAVGHSIVHITLFSTKLSEFERRELILHKYKIPQDEYPDEELRNMGFIEEDSKRRYTREATVEHVRTLMAKLDISVEEALDLLDVSDFNNILRIICCNLYTWNLSRFNLPLFSASIINDRQYFWCIYTSYWKISNNILF